MLTCNIAKVQDSHYTMSMIEANVALGTYLKLMREGRPLKPSQVLAELSKRLGKEISWSRLSRTEKGEFKEWPNGDFLTALYDIVQADIDDVAWIQRTPDANVANGVDLANKRLAKRAQQAKALAEQASEDRTPSALVLIQQLRENPDLLRELRGLLNDGSGGAQQP